MGTIATHFRYALLEAWAERRTVLIRLLQFVAISLILGFAFNSAFQSPDFDKVSIGYVSDDIGTGGETYFDQLSSNEAFREVAEFHEVDDFEQGRERVQSGELGALLYAGEDFSTTLEGDDHAVVEAFTMEYSGINHIVVRAVLDGFNSGANALWAIEQVEGQMSSDISALSTSAIDDSSLNDLRKLTGMTYYAVGMLLFLLLFGTESGSFGISKEFLGTMEGRTRLAPQPMWQLFVGKLSAYSLVTFLQGIIFMALTGALLGVDWITNLPLNLLVVYVFGTFAIALGMAVMMLTMDMKKTTTILQVLIIGLTFLGGGFVAANFFGAEYLSPNFYAREALFGSLYGDATDLTLRNSGILAAAAVVLVIVSAIASRRKTS